MGSAAERVKRTLGGIASRKAWMNAAEGSVATILPFLAQPDRHMLLKPKMCCEMADAVGFHLHYNAKPN